MIENQALAAETPSAEAAEVADMLIVEVEVVDMPSAVAELGRSRSVGD